MVKKSNDIIIALSKKWLVIYLCSSFIFVVIGFLLLINPSDFISPISKNIPVIEIIGCLGIIIFGFASVLLLKKLIDKKSGLILSEQGIYDNASSSGVGLIEWEDIESIVVIDKESERGIVIKVTDHEKYIARIKNKLVKINMRASIKWYESPIIITAANLEIDDDELQKLITQYYQKFKID